MTPSSNTDEHGVAVFPTGEADGDQHKYDQQQQQQQKQQLHQFQHPLSPNPGSIGEEAPKLPPVSLPSTTSSSDSSCLSKSIQKITPLQSPTTYPSSPSLSEQNKLRIQVFGIIIPFGCFAWIVTHSVATSIAAFLLLPFIAILQGSLAIIRYRVKYGNSAPFPKTPCHGIVRTEQDQVSTTASTPLRLLVIGDSLAVGVGQSKKSTPFMPETIAHQLSQAMNGRPVLWTCHGAPGASAGWIVRELERSIQQQGNPENDWMMGSPIDSSSSQQQQQQPQQQQNPQRDRNSISTLCTIQSESSEESVDLSLSFSGSSDFEDENDIAVDDEEMQSWEDKLKQERIPFDANQFGPFDIAVVLTGSNDLKAEFFPCLLKGQDVEFQKQAQLRGGSYGNELSRLLQALNKRMRLRLQIFRASVRESVEAATERVRERLGSCDDCRNSSNRPYAAAATTMATLWSNYDNDTDDDDDDEEEGEKLNDERTGLMTPTLPMEGLEKGATQFCRSPPSSELEIPTINVEEAASTTCPMVVLPGMPSRSLPIFHTWPLRWFTVPVVDIMDSHKRKMADKYPGEVLFVPAPTTEDLTDFVIRRGKYYYHSNSSSSNGSPVGASTPQHNRLLNLKSIKRWQAQDIEAKMKEYYRSHDEAESTALPDNPRKQHFALFSVDGIHPNDEGYEFWGNFISNAIIEEMQRKESVKLADR